MDATKPGKRYADMQIHKTHSFQVQKYLLKLVVGLKSKVDEFLEAKYGQVWELKTPQGSILLWVLSLETLPDSYREDQRKVFSCFQCVHVWRMEPRHFEIYPEHSVLLKDLPSRGNILPDPNSPGRRESPLQSSCLPHGGKKSGDSN